jgi:DNA (cytosine-5)-methyltransferase 1/site-specific DNA-methyltransferase (adenine-specific)
MSETMTHKKFRILDLFCGAGGFSYGMHKNSNFTTEVALDFNEHAANTFKQNMPNTCVIVGDITDEKVKSQIITESLFRQVNMIIGGPPCQGFSMKGKKQGLEDPRNFLFREYLHIVSEIQPEVFVIENVKSLLSTAKGWFRDEILSYIKDLGYHVSYGVLNAKRFGVPQGRERAIFICSKTVNIPLPVGNDDIVTVRDAIEDLAYLESGEGEFEMEYTTAPSSAYQLMMRNGSTRLYNHKASNHSDVAIKKLKLIPAESGKEYLPIELRGKQRFNTTWGRLSWDKVSPTIDTRFDTPSNGTNSHPVLNRAITPREAARIQSFDDKFIFHGSKFYIRTQIGNAVPPLLAKAIADAISCAFDNDSAFASGSNAFETNLPDSFKKANGIFYTDIELAKNIVQFLDIAKDKSVIDPCCGTGSFIYALQRNGYSDVYGCDFEQDTVSKCRELTNSTSVYHYDTINNNGIETLSHINHDKFDVVIGNPPYAPLSGDTSLSCDAEFNRQVVASGNNLFVAAIYRTFELCKEDGIISIIVPKNVLHIPAYAKLREVLLRKKTILSIIELGIHFKTVRGEQIVLTVKNSLPSPKAKIKFYLHCKGKIQILSEIEQNFYSDEIIVFTNSSEPHIFSKLRELRPTLKDVCADGIRRGRCRGNVVKGKEIRKFGLKDHPVPTEGTQIFVQNIFSAESGLIACYGGDLPAGETITVLRLGNEILAKYVLGLLHSRLCNYYLIRFIFNNSRLTIHTDANYLNSIPIVSDTILFNEVLVLVDKLESLPYMSEEWLSAYDDLNMLVYSVYGISDEDKAYIEAEMKTISSSKWYPCQNSIKDI